MPRRDDSVASTDLVLHQPDGPPDGPPGWRDRVTRAVLDAVSAVPSSSEAVHARPLTRARELAHDAARKAAAISGGAALVPGPLGLLTLLPDMVAVWRVQAQLVADIAATFGQQAGLDRERMLYCLFKHTAAQLVRDAVVRAGERFIVRKASSRVLRAIAAGIGMKLTRTTAGKGLARYVPLLGAAAVGGYAYYDTRQVAKSAVELFSSEMVIEPASPSDGH